MRFFNIEKANADLAGKSLTEKIDYYINELLMCRVGYSIDSKTYMVINLFIKMLTNMKQDEQSQENSTCKNLM